VHIRLFGSGAIKSFAECRTFSLRDAHWLFCLLHVFLVLPLSSQFPVSMCISNWCILLLHQFAVSHRLKNFWNGLPGTAWVWLNHLCTSVGHFRSCLHKWGNPLCGTWVWQRRTNHQLCCPLMSNPLTLSWTVLPGGSGWWDNQLATQHLPQELVRSSSGPYQLAQTMKKQVLKNQDSHQQLNLTKINRPKDWKILYDLKKTTNKCSHTKQFCKVHCFWAISNDTPDMIKTSQNFRFLVLTSMQC